MSSDSTKFVDLAWMYNISYTTIKVWMVFWALWHRHLSIVWCKFLPWNIVNLFAWFLVDLTLFAARQLNVLFRHIERVGGFKSHLKSYYFTKQNFSIIRMFWVKRTVSLNVNLLHLKPRPNLGLGFQWMRFTFRLTVLFTQNRLMLHFYIRRLFPFKISSSYWFSRTVTLSIEQYKAKK